MFWHASCNQSKHNGHTARRFLPSGQRALPVYVQDSNMKTRKFENGLAVLGALVVMLGVTAAAGSALAADNDQVTSTAVAVHTAGDNTVVDAGKANAETAERALRALELSTLIDLDIAITDRKSMQVAEAL